MALSVKHLNSDASFLLSFEPIIPEFAQDIVTPKPFTILLDPWLTGPSKIFHSKISISTHIHPACISSLSDLPSVPDLVIISQHKSDHCNEATLRQLPASGSKTLILAEPTAARSIKSWKYFDQEKVRTIERWEDPRSTGRESVLRIPVPSITPGGQGGEVTVAFIPQKRDLAGLHAAIGITYRPPPTHHLKLAAAPVISLPLSPPATPNSQDTQVSNATSTNTFLLPPTPPVSPRSLRSVQSASTLAPPLTRPNLNGHFPRSVSQSHVRPTTSNGTTRPISVLFSPHGIAYESLTPYVTSHLVSEAALPLTALLHCMDSITNPWWLGGNICAGVPTGAEIATRLGARVWISAHDGEKDVRGLATGMLKTKRWKREEVEEALGPRTEVLKPTDGRPGHVRTVSSSSTGSGGVMTEVLRLGSGGEVLANGNELLWYSLENSEDGQAVDDMKSPTDVMVKDLDTAKLKKVPGGLKTKKSSRGGLSVRFRSTLVV